MDQSLTTTTNTSAAGHGPDTALGGNPPAAPAGGAVIGGAAPPAAIAGGAVIGGAAPPAADSGGGAEHGGELVVRDGSSKRKFSLLDHFDSEFTKWKNHKGDLGECAEEIVTAVRPVRTSDQIQSQTGAFQEILRTGVEGGGLRALLKPQNKKAVVVHHGEITFIEAPRKQKQQQECFNIDYRIQLDSIPVYDPNSNCAALRISSGLPPLSSGKTEPCVTYKVMTTEEINGTSRAAPGLQDNNPHCFITRHEFSVLAHVLDDGTVKSCQLNLKPTTSPFPDPIKFDRDSLFQHKKLSKYGVVQMYGLPQSDNSFKILGSPEKLKASISFSSVVILPETTNGTDFHKYGSSLSYHMPHEPFRKCVADMLKVMHQPSTAMSSKKLSFSEWIKEAMLTGAVIYRFSFFTHIGNMTNYQEENAHFVFSNCRNKSQLRLFRMSPFVAMNVRGEGTETTSKPKQKAAETSMAIVWSSNQYGNSKESKKAFDGSVSFCEYTKHFQNNVAIILDSGDGKPPQWIKSQTIIKSIKSTWPPSPTGQPFWLQDRATACLDMISWAGAKDFHIAENMTEELGKISKQGGVISSENVLAAMALSLHKANNIAKQCVYPKQHCFMFSISSKTDLASVFQVFFDYLNALCCDQVMEINILQEKFYSESSLLYYQRDKNFVNFLLHFLLGVLFTHNKCETEIDLFDVCRHNMAELKNCFVYDDDSLSNDHKSIFFLYFLMSIMMTILRTIDVLLFIPRKVPLKCIKINSYNRLSPWYLLAVQNIRSSGITTYKKTPYPNEFFFAPVHVMCWLTLISFRNSDERAAQSTADILSEVRALSAAELKQNAVGFLGNLYDERANLFQRILDNDQGKEDEFKEDMTWADAVDSYKAPDLLDFDPPSAPTDLGLKGTWFPPPDSDAPGQPSTPYKIVTDEELGNERPKNLALPPPSAPAAGADVGAAGGTAVASAPPAAPGPGNV